LTQLFHIENTPGPSSQQVLSLRIGEKHACFSVTDKTGITLYQVSYFETAGWDDGELAALLIHSPVLKSTFFEVLVAYDFPQSIQMPLAKYRQDEGAELLHQLFGNNASTVTITETIPAWQLNTVFTVPALVRDWVSNHFPSARCWHQHTIGIKSIIADHENGSLLVDFRKEDFTVVAVRQSQFLLAQTYSYSIPEDVLFYLLKIVQQFSLSPEATTIYLSGLIDKQSSLYKELYQYFIRLELRDTAWETGEYPAHFFTSLNDLARCV
jgi:Protein of unknown function (DUF3822)